MNTLKNATIMVSVIMFSLVSLQANETDKFEYFDKLPKDIKFELLNQHIENELGDAKNLEEFQIKLNNIKLISKEINQLIASGILKKNIEKKHTDLKETLLNKVRGDTSKLNQTSPGKTLEDKTKLSLKILEENPQLKNEIFKTLNDLITLSKDSDMLDTNLKNKSLVGKSKLESLYLQRDLYNLSDDARELLQKLLSE